MEIIIGFKNGRELSIVCDNFKFKQSSVSGELTSYQIDGLEGSIIPYYMDVKDITYICKKEENLEQ